MKTNTNTTSAAAPAIDIDCYRELIAQMFREFRIHLKKMKSVEDKIDAFYEAGSEPPEALSDELEELKDDYSHFMKFFKQNDLDFIFESPVWSTMTAAERCIAEAFK